MNKYHHLKPGVFVKDSLAFMQGYSRFRVWLYMPVAYIRICYYTIFK